MLLEEGSCKFEAGVKRLVPARPVPLVPCCSHHKPAPVTRLVCSRLASMCARVLEQFPPLELVFSPRSPSRSPQATSTRLACSNKLGRHTARDRTASGKTTSARTRRASQRRICTKNNIDLKARLLHAKPIDDGFEGNRSRNGSHVRLLEANYRKTMSSNKRRKASIEVDDDEGGEARGQGAAAALCSSPRTRVSYKHLSTYEPLFIVLVSRNMQARNN